MTVEVQIPKSFYMDHCERDLPAPPVIWEDSRQIAIDACHWDFDELVNDAKHYAHIYGPDSCPEIVRAAKAMLKCLRSQVNID
jgi:hypothetical protein